MYGKPVVSEVYKRYVLCKTFGWDYFTYEAQPARVIEEFLIIMNQEGLKQNKESEKGRSQIPQIPRRTHR